MSKYEIKIHTNAHSPVPNKDEIKGGIDYTAELAITDEAGIVTKWIGAITLAPSQYDGEMVPYGDCLQHWLSGNLCKVLDEPWIAAHPKLVAIIVRDLAIIGDGESTYLL